MLLTRYLFMAFVILLGCKSGGENSTFDKKGNIEEKPQSATTQITGSSDLQAQELEKPQEATRVTYNATIVTRSGAKVCKGLIELVIMTNFSIKLPDSFLYCGSLKIDLTKILDSGGLTGDGDSMMNGNVEHDGMTLKLKELAGASFSPARPFLLGPIVQDVDKYRNYETTSDTITVSAYDPDLGQNISGSGSFHIKVDQVNATYKNDYLDESFTKVLKWEIEKQGFENVPGRYGMLFDKMVWYWNIRPIMIPKLVIYSSMVDFLPSSEDSSTIKALVGNVAIILDAKSYVSN